MITWIFKHKRTVILTGLILFSSMVLAGEPWEVVKNSSEVTVSSRQVPGFSLNQFKGECTIPASLEVIERIMRAYTEYPKWFAMSKRVSVLREINPDNHILYYVIDSPWPVADRDVTVSVSVDFDHVKGTGQVLLKSTALNYPGQDKSYVRIKDMEGRFLFNRINSLLTFCRLTMQVDPLMDMSKSFLNSFLTAYPFDTLKNLRERAAQKERDGGSVSLK